METILLKKGGDMVAGRIAFWVLLCFTYLLFAANWAFPQVPGQIHFQGKLDTVSGLPVPDGDYSMRFYLYNAETGGTQLWNSPDGEEQSVRVAGGIYNVRIGEVHPLTPDVFAGGSAWLEIIIYNPDSLLWELLTPRIPLAAAAYAINAGDADTLAGQSPAAYDQSAHLVATNNPHAVTAGQIGAAEISVLTSHTADPSAHHLKTTSFAELADMVAEAQIPDTLTRDTELAAGLSGKADISHNHDDVYYSQAYVDGLETRIGQLEASVSELISRLANVTRSGSDITFDGVNVHITNGSGTTSGTVNGLGNLIVGYNETRGAEDDRSGSHNIIVGLQHNFSSYGGLVVGSRNTISGAYASVSGGFKNTAAGSNSSVSGGTENTASGTYASVSAGEKNTASNFASSVSGGSSNLASYSYTSVSGGWYNSASYDHATVSGGLYNTASGRCANVSGGRYNIASGYGAFVGGGGGTEEAEGNTAFADYSAILGGTKNLAGDPALANHASGENASISGGYGNTASGSSSSVVGGRENTATHTYASATGGMQNVASGEYSNVNGGVYNVASSRYASVSGGMSNTASGLYASVGGGGNNTASGTAAFIGGGGGASGADGNTAFANYSAILGGLENRAGDADLTNHSIGENATVTGGSGNGASGDYASVSGGEDNNATGIGSSVGGGWYNTAGSTYASVSGGGSNEASGARSSISGGYNNTASGLYGSVSGGRNNTAAGEFSFVGGGGSSTATEGNTAFANYSAILGGMKNLTGDAALSDHTLGINGVISGGTYNVASGDYASVNGGGYNRAGGARSTVSGGYNNSASATYAGVSGGHSNDADGQYSSVGGGYTRSVSGIYDWRAGELFESN